MNRKVLAVLLCTFLALLAATVWVPVEYEDQVLGGWDTERQGTQHCWVWLVDDEPPANPYSVPEYTFRVRWIRWPMLIGQVAIPVVLGGLLALILRTRAARRAAA